MIKGAISISTDKKIDIAQWLLDPDRRRPPVVGSANWRWLEKQLKEQGLEKVFYEVELPLVPILEKMSRLGIKIDLKRAGKLSQKLQKEIAALEKSIYKQAGAEFNLNSPKQLSEILFKRLKIDSGGAARTKTGLRSTDVGVLTAIKDRHPIIALILQYRELFKIRSTYLEPLREIANAGGRVHTTFVQTGTATGRLSSQNPNLQNVPPSVREIFIPEKEFTLASFDYSQIELRVLAFVANDPKMIDAFNKDLDIHALTASQVFNVELKKVTKDQRHFAKTLNFGVIYGMGPVAFARNTGLSRPEAEKFIKEYFSDFAEIKRWQEKTIAMVRQVGYVENLNGRKRWLPEIGFANRRIASGAERAAINMPIQGLAADIIKIAMIKIADFLKKKNWYGRGVRLLLSIHDELLFEVDKKLLPAVAPAIQKIMESAYQLSVPLKVDFASGYNWASLEKH